MTDLTDERINKILLQYENKRKKERERYERIKDTEAFKVVNRNRARNHYNINKEVKKTKYNDNKELLTAKSSYNYYKKLDRVEDFKNKYPNKVKLLSDNNIII
tara:strand:+ start:2801 stop:3109 length:309 start_codon:yes stop_codon:yes gene_type:complete